MSKIEDTQLKNSSQITLSQTAHGFAVGDFVIYDKTSSLWKKANANGNYAQGATGRVIDVLTANSFEIRALGVIIDFSGTAGEFYYVKDDGTGGVTTTVPNNKIQAALFALPNNKAIELRGQCLTPAAIDMGAVEVNSIPIGMPFPQWFDDNAEAVVAKYPEYFIKLSKDLEGSGLYNENKLGASSGATADETTFYTATISDASSPLNGLTVKLINSTENTTGGVSAQPTFLGAGETAQVALVNTGQGHLHGITLTRYYGSGLSGVSPGWSNDDQTTGETATIDTSTPASDTINGTPRTSKTTRPDTATAVWYMRYKKYEI